MIVFLAKVDPKGKVSTPSSKPRKRKLVRAFEGEPKKTKLMD